MSAAGKVNAANLTNGTTILVEPGVTGARLAPARLKTGALTAVVLGVKAAQVGRRTGRAVQVALADGSEAVMMVASVQTFWLAPAVAPATTTTTAGPAADETGVSDTATEEPTMTATPLKGENYTTGTVHLAREVRHLDRSVKELVLAQACGIGSRQVAYLAPAPADAEVTCKRCARQQPTEAVAPATTTTEAGPAADETDVNAAPTTTEEPDMTATTTRKATPAAQELVLSAAYADRDRTRPTEAYVAVTVATATQADAVVAAFPVTANLRVRKLDDRKGYVVERHMVLARHAEDGTVLPVPRSILHLPRIVRHARQLGMTVTVAAPSRACHYQSLAQLDAALAPLAAQVPGWATAAQVTLAG
jgi:hypothetical protein